MIDLRHQVNQLSVWLQLCLALSDLLLQMATWKNATAELIQRLVYYIYVVIVDLFFNVLSFDVGLVQDGANQTTLSA